MPLICVFTVTVGERSNGSQGRDPHRDGTGRHGRHGDRHSLGRCAAADARPESLSPVRGRRLRLLLLLVMDEAHHQQHGHENREYGDDRPPVAAQEARGVRRSKGLFVFSITTCSPDVAHAFVQSGQDSGCQRPFQRSHFIDAPDRAFIVTATGAL